VALSLNDFTQSRDASKDKLRVVVALFAWLRETKNLSTLMQ